MFHAKPARRRPPALRAVVWAALGGLATFGGVTALAATRRQRETGALRDETARGATHDPLTGLPNRLSLRRSMATCLADGRGAGLLSIDVDRFRTVNETAGHATGDALLVAVADRLRAVAPCADLVARVGGDEFAVLCPGVDAAEARELAESIRVALRRPVAAEGQVFTVRVSVGVASSGQAPAEAGEVERQADIAMHVAKAAGGDRAETYADDMHIAIVEREAFNRDLADAVLAGRIEVAYQPIVDLADGRVCRFEALARWHDARRGAVAPDVFIPVADATGVIAGLDSAMLRRACAQVRAWQRTYRNARDVGVAVNVSPGNFTDPGFVETVRDALASSGLAAEHLTIELTEGALVSVDAATDAVARLRALGVRVAIDDFGTGHSSLGRLSQLDVNELKVDRGFIDAIDGQGAGASLVTSILALAGSLHLEVTAEGVETAEQLAFLTAHGCPLGQGFLLSRPLAPDDCGDLLADFVPQPAALGPATAPHVGQGQLVAVLAELQGSGGAESPRMRAVLARLCELTGLEATYLTRVDMQAQVQEVRVAYNAQGELVPEGLVIPWQETVCRRMLVKGGAATDDAPTVFGEAPAVAALGLRTYVGVPVSSPDGALYGTLCAVSRRRLPVSAGTLDLLRLFADLISGHLPAGDHAATLREDEEAGGGRAAAAPPDPGPRKQEW